MPGLSYFSKNLPIGPLDKNEPMIGILLAKLIIAGKNPLKSTKKPYASNIIPVIVHPMRIKKIPEKKREDPFSLCV